MKHRSHPGARDTRAPDLESRSSAGRLPDPSRHFFRPVIAGLAIASLALTAYILWLSMRDLSLIRAGQDRFVGLENYIRFFDDPRAIAALRRTVVFVVAATVLEVAIGFGVVLLLDRDFLLKRLVRAILLVPIIMTPVVIGLTWRFIFNPGIGMINYVSDLLGVAPLDWLGNPKIALGAILIADVWQWTPFVILLMFAALDAIPQDPMDAARIDGAKEWQVTLHVVLPMLRRALLIVAIIRAIDAVKTFDLFFIITRGGPALSTETLNYYGYVSAFINFEISYSVTIAVILAIFTNIALLGLWAVLSRARI